ncbi:sugar lactone lactonase YvrE [Lentzea atacamensis]|uniref:Sugar lactone lactonase YvrE n=1 Tax=Lentzea atacamensis TaxID=531938 RepID=A0A316I344_9PSEU|nr:sugar lactone lactonase YvrE [Lentzea atacamensis]
MVFVPVTPSTVKMRRGTSWSPSVVAVRTFASRVAGPAMKWSSWISGMVARASRGGRVAHPGAGFDRHEGSTPKPTAGGSTSTVVRRMTPPLAQLARKAEGPVHFAGGRYLVWSDIPNDRLLRWDETTGQVSVFRHQPGYANVNTVDRQGRLISCEQGNRRVTRTEHDGSIWFTDPIYGINCDYEGNKGESEIGACHVYRIDPGTGAVRIVADDFSRPNGLAFSADEQRLYIADTLQEPSHIRVFDVTDDGTLTGGKIFAECDFGRFDGIRLDDAGRVWAAASDGLHGFDPTAP